MNKLLRFLLSIILLPIKLIRYFSLGLFFTSYVLIGFCISAVSSLLEHAAIGLLTICEFFYHMVKHAATGGNLLVRYLFSFVKRILKVGHYAWYGVLTISILCFRVLKYAGKGISVPYVFIHNILVRNRIKRREREKKLEAEREKLREVRRLEKERMEQERQARLDEAKRQREKDNYVNENVKKAPKTFGEKMSDFLERIAKNISDWFKEQKKKLTNNSFTRNRQNEKDLARNALLINYEGEDAEKSDTKLLYRYEAQDENGKYVKGYFEAYSRVEVHSYLLSEGYTVYSIKTDKWIQSMAPFVGTSRKKMKQKDLIFFLTQLSTYIKSGIPLVDSLRILERQYKSKAYKRVFKTMIYDLTMGDNFSTAMEKEGNVFPALLINMVKTSEMTGSLPEVLDDMADYYTETEKTRKDMVTAMIYPTIVMIVALGVGVFIMLYVVPKFVEIYESMDASQIPGITLAIIGFSNFLKHYFWLLLLVIIGIIAINIYFYKNVKFIKTIMQWIAMHVPVFGNVIIYNEVTMFTKTFASLLEHNVFITESMDILNKITNNEIYRMLILETITNLAKGSTISAAFAGHWAFPVPAYEMLVTGERTGELPQMMEKVSDYYQNLHRESVSRVKTFIEPVLIITLTGIVGVLVLAIVVPMFNMYNAMEKI